MRKLFAILLSVLCVCSCTSKYDKGKKILKDASLAEYGYYVEHAKNVDNPVAFAKGIIQGNYKGQIEEWYPHSGWVPIKEALENHWIKYGMTYPEIVSVVGEAEKTSKTNGVVEYAYYRGVQLCFSRGKYDHWNTSNTY